MSTKEKLEQAIFEYVKGLGFGDSIINVNWVIGYEGVHLDSENGTPTYTTGYINKDGLPLSGRVGISQSVAKMLIDYTTEGPEEL